MNVHKRWLCNECHREWHDVTQTNANGGQYMNSRPVTVTGNPLDGNNCPFCGSPEIFEIAYKPRFPGLDIPRNGEYTVLPKRREIASISTLIGSERISIREELPKGSTPSMLKIDKPEPPLPLAVAAEIKPDPVLIEPKVVMEDQRDNGNETLLSDTTDTNEIVSIIRDGSPYDLSDMD